MEMSEKSDMSFIGHVFQALKCLFFKAWCSPGYGNPLTSNVGVACSSDLKWLILFDLNYFC